MEQPGPGVPAGEWYPGPRRVAPRGAARGGSTARGQDEHGVAGPQPSPRARPAPEVVRTVVTREPAGTPAFWERRRLGRLALRSPR